MPNKYAPPFNLHDVFHQKLEKAFPVKLTLIILGLNWGGGGHFEPCYCFALLIGQKYIYIENLGICPE